MFVLAHLVPTGVGAALGGFAGDAGPVARLLASVSDTLVTHPNAVNAASLLALPVGAHYVEGYALDGWLAGRIGLSPGRPHRIGLLIDRAVEQMPPGTLEATLNAANAVRAVHGLEIVGYCLTSVPVGCRLSFDSQGTSTGEVDRPETLLDGARRLLAKGATAIAVLTDLGAYDDSAYREGGGVDPIGGLEAIISHLLVSELGVPAAHAPLLPFDPNPPLQVDPRAAAEYLGHTYLPCILMGLVNHPWLATAGAPGTLSAPNAVVLPAGCMGGAGVIAAISRGIPAIAVGANSCVVDVTADQMGFADGVWHVANYFEAAGLVAAMRAGLDPRACRRPLPDLLDFS